MTTAPSFGYLLPLKYASCRRNSSPIFSPSHYLTAKIGKQTVETPPTGVASTNRGSKVIFKLLGWFSLRRPGVSTKPFSMG